MQSEPSSRRVVGPLFRDHPAPQFTMVCPPDKSITHRAIMFASMAKGSSRIFRPLLGEDCISTINVFRSLGVMIEIIKGNAQDEGMLKIESPGWDGWHEPLSTLDYGNSGTTARLLTGVFAATPGLTIKCKGDASLSKRPMQRVVEPLRLMNADIDGAGGGSYLPLTIKGKNLTATSHSLDKSSAQIKSCLLLAGLNCEGVTKVDMPDGSRDHTERFLEALGAPISVKRANGRETVTVKGRFRPRQLDLRIPGDPSSAAFFVVLAALAPSGVFVVKDVLINATRTGFIDALVQAGAQLECVNERQEGFIEPVCDLAVRSGAVLKGFHISAEAVPTLIDEIPVLAVLAMFAQGQSKFEGLGELRVKESDRLEKTAQLIRAAGGNVTIQGNDMMITGNPAHKVQPFTFDAEGDHRLAMANAVVAARADAALTIVGSECVEVSFPDFFDNFSELT